jgi:hypothetical protein
MWFQFDYSFMFSFFRKRIEVYIGAKIALTPRPQLHTELRPTRALTRLLVRLEFV